MSYVSCSSSPIAFDVPGCVDHGGFGTQKEDTPPPPTSAKPISVTLHGWFASAARGPEGQLIWHSGINNPGSAMATFTFPYDASEASIDMAAQTSFASLAVGGAISGGGNGVWVFRSGTQVQVYVEGQQNTSITLNVVRAGEPYYANLVLQF